MAPDFLFSKRSVVNSFWHDVFPSFARFAERCVPSAIQEFLQEPILFHHKIKIDGTFLSRQVWQKLGITSVGLLMHETSEFVEYTYFVTEFGNDINFLEFYRVIKVIKEYKEAFISRMNLI